MRSPTSSMSSDPCSAGRKVPHWRRSTSNARAGQRSRRAGATACDAVLRQADLGAGPSGVLRHRRRRATQCCSCMAGRSDSTRTAPSSSGSHRPGCRVYRARHSPASAARRDLPNASFSIAGYATWVNDFLDAARHRGAARRRRPLLRRRRRHPLHPRAPDSCALARARQLGRRLDMAAGQGPALHRRASRSGTGASTSRATSGRCARRPGCCP